jgi:isoamylase
MRRFVKGDPGILGEVASRLAGSADLYQSRGHLPINSVNFITAHDGFTLYDLVAYNGKHNESNGENNNDGINDNLSWNCGVEGVATDLGVIELRRRQIKNFAVLLLVSQGVPMFVMGDEVARTQNGNNNAYCQDNSISWFDWDLTQKNAELLRFWQICIDRRKQYKELLSPRYFTGAVNERGVKDLTWHSTAVNSINWNDPTARTLAFTLGGFNGDRDLHVMMNMYWESCDFQLPEISGSRWERAIDTSLTSPDDIVAVGQEVAISDNNSYRVNARSIVVLESKSR